MLQLTHQTPSGCVHYWRTDTPRTGVPWLVFLPGLTADHHLFDPQIAFFDERFNCLAWDAPRHGASRPYESDFTLDDFVTILHDILCSEGIQQPALIGQSLGGYLSQVFMELYPGETGAFVSIDSCPLTRSYYADWELWCLERMYGIYMAIPWHLLIKWGASGNSTTEVGRQYMEQLMNTFERQEYCRLADCGFRALAQAVKAERTYAIDCPILLLCGEKDAAGSAKRTCKRWAQQEDLPLMWIPGAGHNSTLDNPEFVNKAIDEFLAKTFGEQAR